MQLTTNSVSPHKQRIAFSDSAILHNALFGRGEITDIGENKSTFYSTLLLRTFSI